MKSSVIALNAIAVLWGAHHSSISHRTVSPAAQQTVARALIGVWRPVEVVWVGTPARRATYETPMTLGPLGPGLRIFTQHHYSYLGLSTADARPDLPDSNVTTKDFLATWQPFGANAGTYEIHGDTIVTSPTIAKNPRTMAAGFHGRFIFRVTGDSLWLTNPREARTDRYVRVE